MRLEAPGDLDLPYCQIGSTGIVISAQDLVLRLSDVQPFPEGIDPEAFDLEPDWKGVYLGRVQVFNLNTLVESLPDGHRPREVVHRPRRRHRQGDGGARSPPGHVGAGLRGAGASGSRSGRTSLLEGLVQLAVKLPYFDDRVVYLDLAITNEPTLDFPESVGFMGSVAGEQPAPGAAAG